MSSSSPAIEADWLGACRRAVSGLEQMLADAPTTRDRARETGSRGSGGDRTLVIDQSAEDMVLTELETLASEGHRFSAFSEERGEIDYGDSGVRVIIDPL